MENPHLLAWLHGILLPLLVSASGHSPHPRGELKERVDLIELNHRFNDLDRHAYDQVIFYEWSPDFQRFHVIAWCLVEANEDRLPRKEPGGRDYIVRWYDRDAKANREVRSRLFRETWSKLDPERENKRLLDEKYRLCLMQFPENAKLR